MQYFTANIDFEVFDEFNGVEGTYIKSFLISDKINLNKWQATWDGIVSNLDSAMGRPGIYYVNPETKKLDHTGATSKVKSLQIQELYRAASIIAVGSDIVSKKAWQISKMVDEKVTKKIKSKEIKWISPSLWPEDGAVEIIQSTDGEEISVVHDFDFLHYAFVDEPAFGDEAEIKSFCDGTTSSCQRELAAFEAAINNVAPLTEHKIIENTSTDTSNTSLKIIPSSETQMANEEELRKELEEAKKSKKAMEDEEKKEKEETAKKAETEKKDEEIKALKAQIESLSALAKSPIIDKIVSAQLSASVISKDSESEVRKSLMAASIESLTQQYELIKPFETRLNSLSQSTVPYYGSNSGSFDASLDEIDDEQLLMEVSG